MSYSSYFVRFNYYTRLPSYDISNFMFPYWNLWSRVYMFLSKISMLPLSLTLPSHTPMPVSLNLPPPLVINFRPSLDYFPRLSIGFLIFLTACRLFRPPCSNFDRKPTIGWNASWHGSWHQRSGNRLFWTQSNSKTSILLTEAVHYLEFYPEKTRKRLEHRIKRKKWSM